MTAKVGLHCLQYGTSHGTSLREDTCVVRHNWPLALRKGVAGTRGESNGQGKCHGTARCAGHDKPRGLVRAVQGVSTAARSHTAHSTSERTQCTSAAMHIHEPACSSLLRLACAACSHTGSSAAGVDGEQRPATTESKRSNKDDPGAIKIDLKRTFVEARDW